MNYRHRQAAIVYPACRLPAPLRPVLDQAVCCRIELPQRDRQGYAVPDTVTRRQRDVPVVVRYASGCGRCAIVSPLERWISARSDADAVAGTVLQTRHGPASANVDRNNQLGRQLCKQHTRDREGVKSVMMRFRQQSIALIVSAIVGSPAGLSRYWLPSAAPRNRSSGRRGPPRCSTGRWEAAAA